MITVIPEDGTIVDGANSYVSVADAEAYFASSLYPLPWATATDDQKAAAVITATRVIDQSYIFFGTRVSTAQKLAFPRAHIPNPDFNRFGIGLFNGSFDSNQFYPYNEIPELLKQAVYEFAKALLTRDRTLEPDQAGIASIGLGNGAVDVVFDSATTPATVSGYVKQIMARFGTVVNQSGQAKLIRV